MKHYISVSRIFALAFLFCIVSACTSDFDEVNTNPSLITESAMKPNMLFTNVLKNSIFDIHSGDIIQEWAGYYDNPASNSLVNRNWADPFMSNYRNYVLNISEAIRLTEGDPSKINQNAMARIWKVWIFHQLTDQYGDIPYFEAGLSVDKAVDAPTYDSQELIYKDMLNELKVAASQLSNSPGLASFGASDLLYSGNVDLWRRFANSLRLRLAMRVRYVDSQLASQHIQEVINSSLIESNDHNALLQAEGANASNVNNRNPLYNRSISNVIPMYGSLTTSETLLHKKDPRLNVYLRPAPEPENGEMYRGRPLAVSEELEPGWGGNGRYMQERVSSLGSFFLLPDYKIMVMSAAEVFFLRAEAALAALSSEDKVNMFRQGVRMSMNYYKIDPTAIKTYEEAEAAKLTGTTENQLKEIIVQKWLANYYQANESWAEYRRTGYPLIWVGSQIGDTDRKIPRRLTYPNDEYFKNEVNLKRAVSRLSNGDSYKSKVWWDAKPGLPFNHPRQGMFPPEE